MNKVINLSRILSLILLTVSQILNAQSIPASFAYQAVIRDANGKLIVEKQVGIQIELAQLSSTGTIVFIEEHQIPTNKQGLVSFEIGSKSNLGTIDWSRGPYFVILSVDTDGGSNYDEIGSYQLLSVPYALYAANGGVAGPKGDPGLSIKSGAVNTNGNLVLTLTDNSTKDVGNVKGSTGSQGAAGRGVTSFIINSSGELVVTYSDNSTSNLGKVKGDNGNAGNYLGSATIDIANNTVSVKDNSISTTKIANSTITTDDIAVNTIGAADLSSMGAINGEVLSYEDGWKPKKVSGGSELWENTFGTLFPKDGRNLIDLPGFNAGIFVGNEIRINSAGFGTGGSSSPPTITISNNNKESIAIESDNVSGGNFKARDIDGTLKFVSGVNFNSTSNSNVGVVRTYNSNGKVINRIWTTQNRGFIGVYDGIDESTSKASIYVDNLGNGRVAASGTKNFFIPHPNKPDSMIWYACIEGPEAGSYERGTTNLVNGEAIVKFSEHFTVVINPKTMTVTTSPNSADSKGLAVIEKTGKGIRVKELNGGKGNYSFDWEVKAVRKGYEDYKVIRHKSDGVADDDKKPVTKRQDK